MSPGDIIPLTGDDDRRRRAWNMLLWGQPEEPTEEEQRARHARAAAYFAKWPLKPR